ncbi:dATP/dGTP diphosphohydrolase domain-containing protein [Mesorhizobium sp. CAU 1732]|uniref:dATP/dGTP diphosphohydrolase domain-containing protein n=1 Tax=Mesorhizobium sp. CAU 1732 TaxID=3140358 RepID=UPI003260E18D
MSEAMPPNPKQIFGDRKPPLGNLPLTAMLAWLSAHYDGGLKYGLFNWRTCPVEAMTYVHAAERHLRLWSAGEELTRDTRIANLGAVMACCAILIDAEAHGTLIDDRIKSAVDADALHAAEAWVAALQAMQAGREKGAVTSHQGP